MKRTLIGIAMGIMSFSSLATYGTFSGKVEILRPLNATYYGEDSDMLGISGLKSMGNCKVDAASGLVIIRIPDSEERAFSVALAAQMAGKEVSVSINDERVNASGDCILSWISINP